MLLCFCWEYYSPAETEEQVESFTGTPSELPSFSTAGESEKKRRRSTQRASNREKKKRRDEARWLLTQEREREGGGKEKGCEDVAAREEGDE